MQSQELEKICTSMDVFNGYGVERMRVWKTIQFLREGPGHGIASSFLFFATMS